MGVLSGLTIVFTGKMSRVRAEMEREAASLGAATEPRVTGRTDFLVTGERVGKKKTNDALQHGCKILTEAKYRQEIQARQEVEAEMRANAPAPRKMPVEHPKWAKKLRNPNSIRF